MNEHDVALILLRALEGSPAASAPERALVCMTVDGPRVRIVPRTREMAQRLRSFGLRFPIVSAHVPRGHVLVLTDRHDGEVELELLDLSSLPARRPKR